MLNKCKIVEPLNLMHLSIQIPMHPTPPGLGWGFDVGLVNAPPLDANPHLIPTQGWGLGGDLYPSGGIVKLTALLCFPKHTKTYFSLSAIFTKAPPLGENFESIPPQSPTLMRVGGGICIDRCIMIAEPPSSEILAAY